MTVVIVYTDGTNSIINDVFFVDYARGCEIEVSRYASDALEFLYINPGRIRSMRAYTEPQQSVIQCH